MGWKLKALAVLFGLMFIPLGAWGLSAILFLYAASGLFLRGLRRGRGAGANRAVAPPPREQEAHAAPAVSFKSRLGHPVRRILGVVFLGLSFVAFAQGGTFSPIVFGATGAVLLLWGTRLVRIRVLGSLRAVDESILLRRGLDPLHWFAVAEVKLATRQAGRALGGVDETVIVKLVDEGPSIFVVLETTSLTMGGAEESLLTRFRELARVSAPRGGYILPLDSGEAVDGILSVAARPVELESKGWPYPLSTTDYDLLAVEARRGGFVQSIGAYKVSGEGDEGDAAVPPPRQTLSRPVLLWEVLQELGKKVEWQKPDAYTTFLASMFATGGEVIGERVGDAGSAGNPQQVLVQSLGTPPIQMSRAQLRAIARVYS